MIGPILERLAKPAVVGRVRVQTHEGVVDRLVALEDLQGGSHGICSTQKDQVNEDLLAFFEA